jgi:hypothetical protein
MQLFRPLLVTSLVLLQACSGSDDATVSESDNPALPDRLLKENREILNLRAAPNPERNAYFGDLHVHTAYSFDAVAFGTVATPYDAYRYARGESIDHPAGYSLQLREPLDFYGVTDHAVFLGMMQDAMDPDTVFGALPLSEPFHGLNDEDNRNEFSLPKRAKAFDTLMPSVIGGLQNGSIKQSTLDDITKRAWLDTIAAAELYNKPGEFTTFVAYEYTARTDERGNLHRNVVFKGSDKLPAVPFSRLHGKKPEDLWRWMDSLRDQGIDSLAIPHNPNGSNGAMFALLDSNGEPLDREYAETRMRNEPIVEVTQIKGTSDTHPSLSSRDEWADFEIMPFMVATRKDSEVAGSYVRDGYLRGLQLAQQGAGNPYQFGLIGSSDTHVAATSDDESNYFSKAGLMDSTAELRGSVPLSAWKSLLLPLVMEEGIAEVDGEKYMQASSFETWSASGLAGVWAEENTRDALFDAMRRKEVFATTGPRIKLRFFAGYEFEPSIVDNVDRTKLAYEKGVPQGAELSAQDDKVPQFLVWAQADARSQALQRIQVIKGFIQADGTTDEKVYDVACSDGLAVNPETQRCPDNGAQVSLDDCSTTPDKGDAELISLWQDPDFKPGEKAFYYVRVLENPSCRWSTWDAVRAGVAPRSDLAKTIQERAWSSPIWYGN